MYSYNDVYSNSLKRGGGYNVIIVADKCQSML